VQIFLHILYLTIQESATRGTDNFFPSPETKTPNPSPPAADSNLISSPYSAVSKATVPSSNVSPNKAKAKKTEEAPSTPIKSPSKKKAVYVPPSPITSSGPEISIAHLAKSEPSPSKADNNASLSKLPKGKNDAINSKKLHGSTNSFDLDGEESIDVDNFLSEANPGDKAKLADASASHLLAQDESDDDDDEFGHLVLNRDDFDPTVISSMTNDVSSAMRPVQQYQEAVGTPEPSSESGMRFDELYRLKGVLGTGAFSTVREGFHRSNTNISYAVKCINRKKLTEEDELALMDEVAILKAMRHIHIIRLYDFFSEASTYYLVMERMRGGELFDRIVAKAYYNEKEARDTCKIVLEAVGHCHSHKVAHRDLKPENLLLLSEDDDSAVKIADFGFAKRVKEPLSLKTQCGTPGYVAPEILEGTPYDERADMWSVGVILYILLGGYPPFIESTQRDLFRKIRKGDYEFHAEYWGTVSSEAKDLISNLLMVDYKTRLTAEDAMHNSWILGDDAKLATRDLGVNLDKLRNFNAKRKFRAAVSTVMAVNKLNSLSQAFFNKPS
jgi:calcium/calmodulin-dependent protein kinase I